MGQGAGQKKITRLTGIDTTGVALVTRGANKRRFALTKGDDSVTIENILAQVINKGDLPLDEEKINEICAGAGLDAQQCETFKAILKLSSAYLDSPQFKEILTNTLPEILGTKTPAPKEETKALAPAAPGAEQPKEEPKEPPKQFGEQPKQEGAEAEDDEKEVATAAPAKQVPTSAGSDEDKEKRMTAKSDTLPGAGNGEGSAKTEATVDALAKSQAQVSALDAVVKSQKDALDALRADMQAERDARVLAEWVAKAEKDLAFVPGKTAQELGQMLFDVEKKVSTELAKSQFETMKASSIMLQKSAMFKTNGLTVSKSASGGEPDAYEKIVKTAGTKETDSVAVVKAMENDPSLYEAYLEQNPKQSGNRYN